MHHVLFTQNRLCAHSWALCIKEISRECKYSVILSFMFYNVFTMLAHLWFQWQVHITAYVDNIML